MHMQVAKSIEIDFQDMIDIKLVLDNVQDTTNMSVYQLTLTVI